MMLIGPHLLKKRVLNCPTHVFLCGPGSGTDGYSVREQVRKSLEDVQCVNVTFGEEIEGLSPFRRRRHDLQTLENEFAHAVDFTLLLLNSPGSIAELGTFSMVKNIRARLIVLVPNSFYKASSYIARGPLSLIARDHISNVIYYDNTRQKELISRILYPLTFYKFAHNLLGADYRKHIVQAYRQKDYTFDSYEQFVAPARESFGVSITLIAVIILGMPTFAELVSFTYLSAKQTSLALHTLLREGKVAKLPSGHYRPVAGYSDPLLESFNSTAISKARSARLARLDQRLVA